MQCEPNARIPLAPGSTDRLNVPEVAVARIIPFGAVPVATLIVVEMVERAVVVLQMRAPL